MATLQTVTTADATDDALTSKNSEMEKAMQEFAQKSMDQASEIVDLQARVRQLQGDLQVSESHKKQLQEALDKANTELEETEETNAEVTAELEKAYEARPFRVYAIEAATGKTAYASGPNPFNIPAKLADITAFVKGVQGA